MNYMISSQIGSLDRILSDGIKNGMITEISGLRGTGKTHLALQFAIEPLSKNGTAMGLEQFSTLSWQTSLPILALGGITPKRVAPCIQAGASGVAMISSVMKAPNPQRVLWDLHRELKNASPTKRSRRKQTKGE